MLKILYEDQDIIVPVKPAGLESQSAHSFEPDMVSEIRKHAVRLSTQSSTNSVVPYVGVIHRLDKPVGGVMVYAKNQKAAAALSKQVQEGKLKKTYCAVICGKPVDNVGKYVDFLRKDEGSNYSQIVDKSVDGSKRAELSYEVLGTKVIDGQELSLVKIHLITGRHHQIRVQFAGHGFPLLGDAKYGKNQESVEKAESASLTNRRRSSRRRSLALWAMELRFVHPVTGENLSFSAQPEGAVFKAFF